MRQTKKSFPPFTLLSMTPDAEMLAAFRPVVRPPKYSWFFEVLNSMQRMEALWLVAEEK